MESVKSFVIAVLVVVIALGAIIGIFLLARGAIGNEQQVNAFCQSIDGNYGGGKCYKNGVEVKAEK